MMGYSAVFCAVRAVFLVILGSKAAEGAPFASQVAIGGRRSFSPLKGAFSFDSTVSERGSRATDLNAFFSAL